MDEIYCKLCKARVSAEHASLFLDQMQRMVGLMIKTQKYE